MYLKLLETFSYMTFGELIHSVLLDVNQEVEFQGHRVGMCLALVNISK